MMNKMIGILKKLIKLIKKIFIKDKETKII